MILARRCRFRGGSRDLNGVLRPEVFLSEVFPGFFLTPGVGMDILFLVLDKGRGKGRWLPAAGNVVEEVLAGARKRGVPFRRWQVG